MSDGRLRELERAWRTSGAREDEVRWIEACVRAGELPPERVALAAYVGHEAAGQALGPDAPSGDAEDLRSWVLGLMPWGKAACLRVALAAARCVLPVYARQHPTDDRPRLMIEAVEDWLLDVPDATERILALQEQVQRVPFQRARYAYALVLLLESVLADEVPSLATDLPPEVASRLCSQLEQAGAPTSIKLQMGDPGALQRVVLEQDPANPIAAIKAVREVLGISLAAAQRTIQLRTCYRVASEVLAQSIDPLWDSEGLAAADVLGAVRREVVPWALHDADPVREHVHTRPREPGLG